MRLGGTHSAFLFGHTKFGDYSQTSQGINHSKTPHHLLPIGLAIVNPWLAGFDHLAIVNDTMINYSPAAVCPLKYCITSPVLQSHIPTVLSNDAVITFVSSKQMSAQVCVLRATLHWPSRKSQSLTDRSSDPESYKIFTCRSCENMIIKRQQRNVTVT